MRNKVLLQRRGVIAVFAVLAVGLAAGLATGEEIKGKVKSVVKKTKTVAVNVKDKGTVVLSVDDATVFVNARSLRQLDDGDLIRVWFTPTGAGNRATTIERVVAKLPAGVVEITTDELNALIGSGQTFTLIDARPASRYDEGHIPGAVSIPFPKLEKADAEGAVESLLGADKGALIVFYCGGIT
ncbi:MAG: rhodanese-like domain-containing protein [Deferrisomatales bacterium]|nr:rhodanese-like domain-containing protein [Deferrisomatales bacterium]